MQRIADMLFGDDYSFSTIGAGRMEFPLVTQAATRGGHMRVGLEDNLYLSRGRRAEANAELVEKAVDLAWEVAGRGPATPAEVREFLGLKGRDAVAFG